ncbi:MAG TPA: M23 family metallopeptidase [Ilumatobacteraceae bacterium]
MENDANRTRRQLIVSAIGLAGAAAVARVAGPALFGRDRWIGAADLPAPSGPATAAAQAVRLGPPSGIVVPPSGLIAFPLDPGASCLVLDNFGDCRDGGTRAHIGVDIMDERGRAVFAVADGVLSTRFDGSGTAGYGWTLTADDGRRFRYFHLEPLPPLLQAGSRVAFGDVLGGVGSSGNDTPNNVHLHFEVYVNRVAVDPRPRMHIPAGVQVQSMPSLKDCIGLT